MASGTSIEWADATFNPWWGCTKVSPGCEHCYAEAFSARMRNNLWGPAAGRRVATESYWGKPLAWNAAAVKKGKSYRVFVASMSDVCEDRADLDAPRRRLQRLIEDTPALTWMLLTKRPENFNRLFGIQGRWGTNWPKNVWAMTTVENQAQAGKRVPELLKVPAMVRGLSCEPLLEAVDLEPFFLRRPVENCGFVGTDGCCEHPENMTPECHRGVPCPVYKGLGEIPGIDWVIVGGESGANARPMHPYWARALRGQCQEASVPFLFKQWGEWLPHSQADAQVRAKECEVPFQDMDILPGKKMLATGFYKVGKHPAGRLLDGVAHDGYPEMAVSV